MWFGDGFCVGKMVGAQVAATSSQQPHQATLLDSRFRSK